MRVAAWQIFARRAICSPPNFDLVVVWVNSLEINAPSMPVNVWRGIVLIIIVSNAFPAAAPISTGATERRLSLNKGRTLLESAAACACERASPLAGSDSVPARSGYPLGKERSCRGRQIATDLTVRP